MFDIATSGIVLPATTATANATANCSSTTVWFGADRATTLALVGAVGSAVSCAGALFIVLSYFLLPELWMRKHVYGMKLVM